MKFIDVQNRSFNTNAVMHVLLPCVLLGLPLISCDRATSDERGPGVPGTGSGESPPSEQQVFYWDMLDAYERGELEQARALAKKYLVPAYDDVLAGKERGWGQGLRVLAGMLWHESRLPVERRFGGDDEFTAWLEELLVASRDLIRATPAKTNDEATSRQKVLKQAAMQWILARRDQVSREKLEDWYAAFRTELEAPGYATKPFASLDDLLASATPTAKRPMIRELAASEADRLTTAIRDYFEGLVGGDVTRLEAATGLDDQRVKELLDAYRRDCSDEGIAEIRSVLVPTLSADNLKLRSNPKQAELFTVSIQGIRMEMVRVDGTVERRTISKNLTLREDDSGRWTIVPPK